MIAQTMKAYYLFEMKKYNKDYKKKKNFAIFYEFFMIYISKLQYFHL